MNAGIDIGYSDVKAKTGNRRATFPSVSGTPDKSRFSLDNGNKDIILNTPTGAWMVGQGAVEQSRFAARLEDRKWILSDEYYRLMLAAFTELTTATGPELRIVTGLPVAFYAEDTPLLKERFLGEHTANREGRNAQRFKVVDCRVIPQPFGALLSVALNNAGAVVDNDLTGSVGVIDIGGKTTNLLSVNRLKETKKETISVNLGAWDIVRAIRDYLSENYPDRDLRDHQIINAIITRKMKYYGETVDLTSVVEDTLQPMARQIIAQATQLWNGGAGLDAVLVAGGGAHLFGAAIKAHFKHARLIDNPVFANVTGYWKLAQRVAK